MNQRALHLHSTDLAIEYGIQTIFGIDFDIKNTFVVVPSNHKCIDSAYPYRTNNSSRSHKHKLPQRKRHVFSCNIPINFKTSFMIYL